MNHCDERSIHFASLMQDLRAAVSVNCIILPVYACSINTKYKDRADSFMHPQVK